MIRWRYYLKMLRYEQFLIPLALLPLFVLATTVVRNPQKANDLAAETGRVFIEAVLPLVAALIGSAIVLNDPVLELQYTLPRPLWRTQLERLALLVGILALFYLVFVASVWFLGVPWVGWSDWTTGWLVWLGPTLGWLGLAWLGSAWWRSAVAGSSLAAGLWILGIFTHDQLLATFGGRLIMPSLTIFDPTNADWPLNRLVLVGLGLLTSVGAAWLMRRGEQYIGGEK